MVQLEREQLVAEGLTRQRRRRRYGVGFYFGTGNWGSFQQILEGQGGQAPDRGSVVYSAVRPDLGSQESKHYGEQLIPEMKIRQGQGLEK